MGKQKIIKVGNSVAVVVPKEVLQKTGWKAGDEVVVEADRVSEGMGVYTTQVKNQVNSGVTPEFLKWLEDFHRQYGADLRELAKR